MFDAFKSPKLVKCREHLGRSLPTIYIADTHCSSHDIGKLHFNICFKKIVYPIILYFKKGDQFLYLLHWELTHIFEVYAWPDVTLRESGSLATPGSVVEKQLSRACFWDVIFFG